MAKRIPFEPGHAKQIRLQPRQQPAAHLVGDSHYVQLARAPSIAIVDGDEVLMCGGIFEIWPGRAIAWAMLAESIGHRMVSCVRIVRRFFDEQAVARVEMDVEVGHEEGHRFAHLLGFELESPRLRRYYPDGGDGALYVRITP